MLLIIGCVLLILWLAGFFLVKKTVGAAIHILLVIAIIALAIHFLGGHAVP
ncbi:MAG TPA: lmo0937 family membrane protein [Gemmatimonadaceae bacterium]|nr:lmo0937 family membrane protein [Gemmatimonadaceae bacterium]